VHQIPAKDVIEIEHKKAVEVPTDFNNFAQDLPAAARHNLTICFIPVTVRNLTVAFVFQGIDQCAHVTRIIQVIISKVTNIFTLGPHKRFIERIGQAAIFLPVYEDYSLVVE
jgi:hypothetical protein